MLNGRRRELEKLKDKAYRKRTYVGTDLGLVASTVDGAIESFFRNWVDPIRLLAKPRKKKV